MGVVNVLQRALWSSVAVDLGTVDALICRAWSRRRPGWLVSTCRRRTGDLVAVGKPSAALWGRSPRMSRSSSLCMTESSSTPTPVRCCFRDSWRGCGAATG